VSAAPTTPSVEEALAHARELLGRAPSLAARQAAEILRVVPGHAATLAVLGEALAAQGKVGPSIAALRQALSKDPLRPDVWRLLAAQLAQAGDFAGVGMAQAAELRASVHHPRLQQAAQALVANDIPIAERLLKAHLREDDRDIAALRMLAEVAGRIGRYDDARTLLEHALEIAPTFAPARFNLALVHYRQQRFAQALEQIERLLEAEPGHPAYGNLKAAALTMIGETDAAVDLFEDVLAARPDQPRIWTSYGHSLKTVGRQDDSVAAYRRAIDLEPRLGEAWWSLANLKTVRFGAEDIAAMEAALARDDLSAEDRFHLHFALGKAQEDARAYEPSFAHYAEGNRLRRSAIEHVPATRRVERMRAMLTPDVFAARAGQGDPARDPIFVLGMPRAGSTLIEQILSSHSAVEGTQELPDIRAIAGNHAGADRDDYPAGLLALDPARLAAMGAEYLERTRVHRRTGRPLFIDKMPNNWLHVPLIHLILPNATIIDARRHPMACCFSNFKQHFARGQAFSYDLAEMGRYYADYVALMDHVDAVLPGRVHRVHYEAMVADTEGEVRRLLDHVGLPFEPACLRFHENARAVRTASSEQVRRPIFREGLDQHRHYEAWLGSLRDALGPVLERYPYPM
jgi:tetratricopeptide (TPR) repeat protein